MKRTTAGLLFSAVTLTLTSCTSLEPERENVVVSQTPPQFQSESGSAELQLNWWEGFQSPQLDQLMAKAFAGNFTLEQAAARLQQAEATARKVGADGKLQVNGEAGYGVSRADSSTTRSVSLGLAAGYEVDLWGRISSTEKAALANWEASKFDMQTAAMTLSAELASRYFTWLTQNEILAVYMSQQKSNLNKLSAIELRYQTGQATVLDLLQQRQLVAADEAKLPPVRASIVNSEHAIAIYIGQIPGSDLQLQPEPLPALPPRPDAGLPVNLLENRPDIQSARLALASADWTVGAARAARLPTLSLSGSVTTSGENFDDLFNDWASNLAANLLAPLLDGGGRKAEVDRSLAVSREKIAAYRLAVLEAVQETEDALSDESHQADYLQALQKQYEAARKSEAESIRRYQRGILPFLDVLTAVLARESLEITTVQAQNDLLTNRIQLYRALGGDWSFIQDEN